MKISYAMPFALSLLACIFTGSFASATESSYLVNQNQIKKGALAVELARVQNDFTEFGYNADRTGTSTANLLRISYLRPLADTSSFHFSTNVQARDVSYDQYNQSNTVTGLSDLALGYKTGVVYDPATLIFGANLSLSPGPAQVATKAQNQRTAGNNFSGFQSISPFIGAESYIDEIAVGGRFIVNIFSSQQVESNELDTNIKGADASQTYQLEAFFEAPIENKINLGLTANIGRKDLRVDQYFQGGNEFSTKLYGTYTVDQNSTVTASLSSNQQVAPIEKTGTEIAIGLRHAL